MKEALQAQTQRDDLQNDPAVMFSSDFLTLLTLHIREKSHQSPDHHQVLVLP